MKSQTPKQVRGMKRNQIIQRWLQGIEDPDYEVFPTKKEGKYIIKPRLTKDQSSDNLKGLDQDPIDGEHDEPVNDIPKRVVSRREPVPCSIDSPSRLPKIVDSTINLEILEQLRSLGEEIRNDRFKKEQKQYIKQVVNKELSKPRIRSRYVPDLLPNEEPEHSITLDPTPPPAAPTPEPTPPPVQQQEELPVFRSRIRR